MAEGHVEESRSLGPDRITQGHPGRSRGWPLRFKLVGATLAWLGLFSAGALLASEPYRNALVAPPTPQGASDSNTQNAPPNSSGDDVDQNRPTGDAKNLAFVLRISIDTPEAEQNQREDQTRTDADEDALGNLLRNQFRREMWLAFLMASLTFTPTNLAMLCCCAAILGSVARRMGRSDVKAPEVDFKSEDRPVHMTGAVIRGLCVFFLLTSGLVVITGEVFDATNVSQAKYIRLAALASILSLWVGFQPAALSKKLFTRMPP